VPEVLEVPEVLLEKPATIPASFASIALYRGSASTTAIVTIALVSMCWVVT
jgi:hypothetical protein